MSDATRKLIRTLLDWGIKALGAVIPLLGGILGTPIVGWIAGLLISWLGGVLIDFLELRAKYAEIDGRKNEDVADAQLATEALRVTQGKKDATPEERSAALEAFRAAVRKLTRPVL